MLPSKSVLCAVALLAAALLYYAQTAAFAWDEGFHLLAAQLIHNGRRPYLDFFFPQTPLNAYWNAAWMQIFGDTWRVAHTAAALCTAIAALLLAQYLQARLGTAAALCSVAAFGLNELVFRYGGIAQAYGFCLLMLVCAFRCAVLARERSTSLYAAAAGLFASASVAASLLTAPVAPIFLLWLFVYTRNIRKAAAFLAGSVVPFVPVLVLAAQSPRVVFFQVFQYNFSYRAVLWHNSSAVTNNVAVYRSFFHSPAALVLVGLSLVAIARLRRTPDLILCASLVLAMGLYIATPFPTFGRYFVFLIPFLTVLAVTGLQSFAPNRPAILALIYSFFCAVVLAPTLYAERESYRWNQVEQIARKVNEVTAPKAPIAADEQVYFVARRIPPSGMEHENSHKPLPLPPAFLAELHVFSKAELNRLTKAGAFATVATCDDEDTITSLGLPKLYRQNAEAGECTVYWGAVK